MYLYKLLTVLDQISSWSRFSEQKLFAHTCFRHAASTPLTVLYASLEELQTSSSALDQNLVHKSLCAVQQLNSLVSGFYDSESVATKISLITILQEISTLLSTKTQQVTLKEVTIKPAVIECKNTTRLTEALICLIKNAVEANEESNKPVTISITEQNQNLIVTIRDQGRGMSSIQMYLSKLPFVSFKPGGSGIGLGFAISVIENEMNGRLHITSEQNKGTVVQCSFPK